MPSMISGKTEHAGVFSTKKLDVTAKCISACSLRGMKECHCDAEEDNYCYLCCGNVDHQCLPAHHHNILRPNGERWEREACSRCRVHGVEMEGLPCDDTDSARLCITGRCSNSVCHTRQPGSFCDRKMEKICVDNMCENPCARFAPHLMVCDCPAIDQDTGFASEDRCQLCCYDFNLKPANRRCQNAYRKYKVTDLFQKPIWRVGLECAGGKTCNKYGRSAFDNTFISAIVGFGVPVTEQSSMSGRPMMIDLFKFDISRNRGISKN
ncbi:hypothetical protein DICVIV_05141 [Dictyocaulus viviparus]|uniref:Uncharacterized protein n=1 Tax=Dictyocaulus viviparus TaxID=29172 RepID=A0A0D8XY56_DICVI|nr:hypothetical protein DICVIV_05141 [Dictyocaulus viviparus]